MGQTAGYQYQADIDRVDSSGFYNIVLTPEINAHLKNDYSDLRIVNDSGKWIPHISWSPNEQYNLEAVESILKIIKKENTKSYTDIIVESSDSNSNRLHIKLKNTLAERYCTLTGSDDLLSWYIINDSIAVKPEKNSFDNNCDFTIEFPPVTYKYFRIYIHNEGRDPFNIINIFGKGITPGFPHNGKWISRYPDIENPLCSFKQSDSSGFTYIDISQQSTFHFSKIALKVSGAKYYFRNAELYIPENPSSHYGKLVGSFAISNNSTLEFTFKDCNAAHFFIKIINNDNPPLKIESIKTFTRYIVSSAWLEKINRYKIIMQNEKSVQPNFDLQLSDVLLVYPVPPIGIGPITSLQPITNEASPTKNNKWQIWLLIFVAIFVLGFFTFKLITDMNKSKP
jgi:hypothetical protein